MAPLHYDEGALLKAYGLDSLEPRVWTDVGGHGSKGVAGLHAEGDNGPDEMDAAVLSELLADEPDPLGLRGTISMARQVDKSIVPHVHPSSKLFDPKTFLSTLHPDATFADLNAGNAFLRQSIDQRSEALKILVESNFDKFVAVKATTDGVYREMKDSNEGPLRPGNEHGVHELRESLANASAKADQVFMPVLENNLKAVKLRNTLGVFERSRFFFNLPGVLGEALEAGRYEQALRDYKRGKYLLDSRPGQLLNFTTAPSAAGAGTSAGPNGEVVDTAGMDSSARYQAQQQRVFAKVWDAVESTMQEMRDRLFALLKEPKRGVEEQEKTIEILLELEPTQDPVAVFLESQYNHIRELMHQSYETSSAKVESAASVEALVTLSEKDRANDLQACVRQLASSEHVYDRRIGVPGWQAILSLVRLLSETMVQTLPSFWRVGKNLADGKIKSRSRGIQAQARQWASESVQAYATTLAGFFSLTDVSILARQPLSPLPSWIPRQTCSMTAGHFMKLILSELAEAVNDLRGLNVPSTADSLDALIHNAKFTFTEALCQLWQEDAKIFHRLEDWTMNPEEEATTLFLGELAAFQNHNARVAYALAKRTGKDSGSTSAEQRRGSSEASSIFKAADETPASEYTARIKATFVDAIYVCLDGLVHLAFSEYNPLDATTTTSQKVIIDKSRQAVVIDVKDLDTRVLLGVTNLGHFSQTVVPTLANQFHEAFRVRMNDDLRTIEEVASELDKILFNNFIERKGNVVSSIFRQGILHGGIDWRRIPEPTGGWIKIEIVRHARIIIADL